MSKSESYDQKFARIAEQTPFVRLPADQRAFVRSNQAFQEAMKASYLEKIRGAGS